MRGPRSDKALVVCRGVGLALVGIAVALTTTIAVPTGHATARYACGVDRWNVKTLQDRPHLLANRLTTIKYLVTRPRPSDLPSTRLPFERHVFTVIARV